MTEPINLDPTRVLEAASYLSKRRYQLECSADSTQVRALHREIIPNCTKWYDVEDFFRGYKKIIKDLERLNDG